MAERPKLHWRHKIARMLKPELNSAIREGRTRDIKELAGHIERVMPYEHELDPQPMPVRVVNRKGTAGTGTRSRRRAAGAKAHGAPVAGGRKVMWRPKRDAP